MSKLKIGIDVNEILRALWLKFDKCYVIEFGEESVSKNTKYSYDYLTDYKWNETIEEIKMLNEKLPDDINPLDYQVDPKTGEAPIDSLAFKKEKKTLTRKEVYNRFMYEDYLFEIFGGASVMYRNMEVDVENFREKYSEFVDFYIVSKENKFSIPPTLFFLSRTITRFNKYLFLDDINDVWDDVDVLITTDPKILDAGTPEDKKIIKLSRPYNVESQDGSIKTELLQIKDLIDNEDFEKIINYNKKLKK